MADIPGTTIQPNGWWKADAITGVLNNGTVTTWPDSGPGTRIMEQTSALLKPIYKTSEQNGQPVVRFDGSDDRFNLPEAFANTSPLNVFVVMKSNSDGAEDRIILDPQQLTTWAPTLLHNSAGAQNRPRIRYQSTTLLTYSIAVTGWNIYRFRISNTQVGIQIASRDAIGAEQTAAVSQSFQGYFYGFGSNAATIEADVGEGFVILRDLTNSEIAVIYSYLREKWFGWREPSLLMRRFV